jgi:hypothetical protein
MSVRMGREEMLRLLVVESPRYFAEVWIDYLRSGKTLRRCKSWREAKKL